jgi:FixJ family two-component response regulator
MTGYPDVASSVRAMKAGAVDFLEEPVTRAALFDALQRALARDAGQRHARAGAEQLRSRFASLSPREHKVLERVLDGALAEPKLVGDAC